MCKGYLIGREPVSLVHYIKPGSSNKWPTLNYLASQCHVNWGVVYLDSSYKNIEPVSAAFPQNLRRIFVAALALSGSAPTNGIIGPASNQGSFDRWP